MPSPRRLPTQAPSSSQMQGLLGPLAIAGQTSRRPSQSLTAILITEQSLTAPISCLLQISGRTKPLCIHGMTTAPSCKHMDLLLIGSFPTISQFMVNTNFIFGQRTTTSTFLQRLEVQPKHAHPSSPFMYVVLELRPCQPVRQSHIRKSRPSVL